MLVKVLLNYIKTRLRLHNSFRPAKGGVYNSPKSECDFAKLDQDLTVALRWLKTFQYSFETLENLFKTFLNLNETL